MTAYEKHFLVASRLGVRDTTGPTSSSAASTITTGSSSIACTFFIFFSRSTYPEAAAIEGELIWKGESIEEVIERILTTGSL
jgi:hypothetical protein